MTTLDSLKSALREKAALCPRHPLSDVQYSIGFDILFQGSEQTTYGDFVVPQLSQLLAPLFDSRLHIFVLEIGPGPNSVLGSLPRHMRQKIGKYVAFEPNRVFASRLEEQCGVNQRAEPPFPSLASPPDIRRVSFMPKVENSTSATSIDEDKFDLILFCHSMYGMRPKRPFVERALESLVERPKGGIVVVFHRDGPLHFDGLVCRQSTADPAGTVQIPEEDDVLDNFAAFIAGFTVRDSILAETVRARWRETCRALGRHQENRVGPLSFSLPNIMVVFDQSASKLPELTAQVPLVEVNRSIKNWEARLHAPAAIVRPTEVTHVQRCVHWALRHGLGLTVLGGGHGGHCLGRSVVAVDMSAFNQVHVSATVDGNEGAALATGPLVVAGAGCTTGDIVRKTMAEGVTVPLGARPSVGAGLWLQGGIGHLARLHGLACDAIVGAVLVGVDSGQLFCIGRVPDGHRPKDAVRPEHENDLLWAIKGAGTNFGIVISVTLKARPAPTYSTRNWTISPQCGGEARRRLQELDKGVAKKLPANCSMDVYLYCDAGQLRLGVTLCECFPTGSTRETSTRATTLASTLLGPGTSSGVTDGIGLFETELYVSGMHGGHGGGRTSSFKRCLFLTDISAPGVVDVLLTAVEARPSPFCYLHLLQGGGAVADVAADAAAFGCRDWDFACVVTGVWARDLDETDAARAAVCWVYRVAKDLLPFSSGAYGADLGPEPRDAVLAAAAFGLNGPRLARLKRQFDPHGLLAHACPLPRVATPRGQKLILVVTGKSCSGKDYCAGVWATALARRHLTARVVSISDATKREYAATTGADFSRLIQDRAYKEEHRSALTTFFRHRVRQRPKVLEEQFLHVVHDSPNVDVLLVTGMRDEAPVASYSHLLSSCRLLEVRVSAGAETRRARGGCAGGDELSRDRHNGSSQESTRGSVDWCPDLVFDNEAIGGEAAERFAEVYLLPFFRPDLQRLTDMVRSVPGYPRPGVEFRHVLGVSQQTGGLSLCTSLLRCRFQGDWSQVGAVACCESGGFIFGSALATQSNVPLVLIREAGKLPPPTVSVPKPSSHVSSLTEEHRRGKIIELERSAVPRDASIVVVDDVLATGETLCAVLRLLQGSGVGLEHVRIMVVAEFPVHRGRDLLRQRGFGGVCIQSLLVFSRT